MDVVIKRLLESEPWTEYGVRVDLLGQNPDRGEALAARRRIAAHPAVQRIIGELEGWRDEVITNHKKADLWLHKLSFLAETGLRAGDDAKLKKMTDQLAATARDDGVVPVKVNVPVVFGGSGKDTRGWSMCDAPLAMYCLLRMGYGKQKQIKKGIEHLANKVEFNGWPCKSSAELGKFRGPGKREDPCPYGTLLMLKLLARDEDLKDSWQAKQGADGLLGLWQHSREKKPYLFKMGTDFRKLKAPFVWYDILHTADVLSQFSWLKTDSRLKDMIDVIKKSRLEDGMYTAQSVWMAWKDFDFAQKKQPSDWITFLVLRLIKRYDS